jgi:hypothetical protein
VALWVWVSQASKVSDAKSFVDVALADLHGGQRPMLEVCVTASTMALQHSGSRLRIDLFCL